MKVVCGHREWCVLTEEPASKDRRAEIIEHLQGAAFDQPNKAWQLLMVEAAELLAEPQQHQKIRGYRDLTVAEIDFMNRIKAKGAELGQLIAEMQGMQAALDQRAVAIARTELQTGIMWLTRAVARPDSF